MKPLNLKFQDLLKCKLTGSELNLLPFPETCKKKIIISKLVANATSYWSPKVESLIWFMGGLCPAMEFGEYV